MNHPSLNHEMGRKHEEFLVDLFGGRQTKGSGNQWQNPADGRTSRKHLAFAFGWDGKSTLQRSISVTLAMWDKIRLQAGGNRPMLALRFYQAERLKPHRDLVVFDANDAAEMAEAANQAVERLLRIRERLVQCMEQDASLIRWHGEAAALRAEIDEWV